MHGIHVDAENVLNNSKCLETLTDARCGAVDVTICNKTLSAVEDGLLSDTVDSIAAKTQKYIILRDYEPNENFNLIKEMII